MKTATYEEIEAKRQLSLLKGASKRYLERELANEETPAEYKEAVKAELELRYGKKEETPVVEPAIAKSQV